MLKNDRHDGLEDQSHHRVRKLHSIDVGFRESHLHHISHFNGPPSRSIRKGAFGLDITDNGDVGLNVLSG
jgi:hypothetical protein